MFSALEIDIKYVFDEYVGLDEEFNMRYEVAMNHKIFRFIILQQMDCCMPMPRSDG